MWEELIFVKPLEQNVSRAVEKVSLAACEWSTVGRCQDVKGRKI